MLGLDPRRIFLYRTTQNSREAVRTMNTKSSRYTCVFLAICCLLLTFAPISTRAQSTQGTILGIVKDTSGSVIPAAEIKITNQDEGNTFTYATDESGNFLIPDLKPGRYRIEVQKDGFKAEVHNDVQLLARQEVRELFVLSVGTRAEVVEVNDAATAINSETPAITASFDSQNVLELPANYRADGSTSPLKLVQSLPGVQPDSDGKYSVQGGLPFMSETSVDGITTQNAGSNNPLSDAWPSAETITELRVDGVGNNAEFGQPGAITSVTKSGTNDYHGGLFWYHQNRAFDATAYGETEKPQKVGNDFGVTGGGPVWIPHLYNGHNRTFFYGTYEGFRFPLGEAIQNIVPTQAMRSGDFSNDKLQTAARMASNSRASRRSLKNFSRSIRSPTSAIPTSSPAASTTSPTKTTATTPISSIFAATNTSARSCNSSDASRGKISIRPCRPRSSCLRKTLSMTTECLSFRPATASARIS
jgi:hypothetical protein